MINARVLAPAIVAAGTLAVAIAQAQIYPTKPIKVIVAFAAGGPADVMARLVGQRISAILGQSIIVENRPGAGGSIGARATANAEADGYTLMLGNTSTLVINAAVYRNLDYDPAKAFVPVAMLGTTSNLLVVPPSSPFKSVQDIVTYAKANPGTLSYSTPGVATPPHLIGELLKLKAAIDIVHVPYKGGGQSTGDVAGSQVQMTFENPAVSLSLVKAGTVRALAITSAARHLQAPEIPTMIESGIPDFVSVSFTGIVAPAGTPATIVLKLNAAINESLKAPDVQAALANLAVDVRPGSPDDFASFLAEERDKWGAVVKAARIQID
jgi:tripartite-type tricarboxylate transporter receptor subunit TctC